MHARRLALLATALGCFVLAALPAQSARRRPPAHEPIGHQTYASPQSDPIALAPAGDFVYVANTTSNSVSVIDTASNTVVKTIEVGMDPVSVAVRPDGNEVWVANHVSDSISVIDTNPASASYRRVVETISDRSLVGGGNPDGTSDFDEPVGIAFASNAKAFVALSSSDRIAAIDAASYSVTGHIDIHAQDPRAIRVANGRLYVAAFESGNQSEVSACGLDPGFGGPPGSAPQCTLFLTDLQAFATNPNLPGEDKNIVIDPDVPDRDLFVFDASTHAQVKNPVTGIGTLLYGLVVDSSNNVYITQTDARNAENGITTNPGRQDVDGDGDINVADLENHMFSNEVAVVDCGGGGSNCSFSHGSDVFDLDGGTPAAATALATPYGVALSADETTLVGTAAATSRVFSMSTSGTVLDRLDLEDPGTSGDEGQQIPRGIVFASTGATGTAYVLNTLENTVSVVTVGAGGALTLGARIPVGNDPTPAGVRRGRIAFNNAFAASSGGFSCASCHPDGNTDQLLWRIGGECFLGGCVAGEDEPRTMPVRGLRDTIPLHWDGSLGDPFGGDNGANGSGGGGGSNCSLGAGGDQRACFRQLVDASLSGVMCDQNGSCPPGGTLLSETEKDDMANFLERVSYPPARERSFADDVSTTAMNGFDDFFRDQGGNASNPNTCADSNAGCHELPLGTSTNSEVLQAFDAPTMRGITDRFLQFSLGLTGTEEFLDFANGGLGFAGISALEPSIQYDPALGMEEGTTFGGAFAVFEPVYNVRPLDMLQMFEEASNGHSGILGQQLTLNTVNTAGCPSCDAETLLGLMEDADAAGLVNLRGSSLRGGAALTISYLAGTQEYHVGNAKITRVSLISEAQNGSHLATLTAYPKSGVSEDAAQPLVAPIGAQCDTPGGNPDPALPSGSGFTFDGAHVVTGDAVFLNGEATGTTVTVTGTSSACPSTAGQITTQRLSVGGLPGTASNKSGTDLLQIRSANGLLSNELPVSVP